VADERQGADEAETAPDREARYFARYEAVPDDDEDFKAIGRLGIESLRELEQ